jgi:hypothetical protein
MARPTDSREPSPAQRVRTVWGRLPIEVILPALTAGAAGLGIGLLLESRAAIVGATLLGGVVVAVGTYRTIQVTREGQITERFTQAIGQLDARDGCGNRKEVVVLGGIYALERIASDSRLDYHPIMEILTSFVRMCVPLPEDGARDEQCEESATGLPNDVQAALAVLARRRRLLPERRLDLRATDLHKAKLPHARFKEAILHDAILCGADLHEGDLRGADLRKAKLRNADLRGADLTDAVLEGAELEGAKYDTSTVWPQGFDKKAAGVVLAAA